MLLFKKYILPISGCFSFVAGVIALIALFSGEEWFAQNKHYIAAHSFYCWVVLSLSYFLLNREELTGIKLPKVLKVISDEIILVEPCNWLSHQTSVAIFKNDDDFERLIALGEVVNVQHDQKIQISYRLPNNATGELPDLSPIKASLMIKPGMNFQ